MADEIIELLKNEKFRAEVIQKLKGVYDDAYEHLRDLVDGMDDNKTDDVKNARCSPRDRPMLPWEEAWLFSIEVIKPECTCFHKQVLARMSRPARITLDDILHGLCILAEPTEYTLQGPDWESVYAVFLSYVQNHLLSYRRLPAFEVCRSPTEGPLAAALFHVLRRARRRSKDEIAKLAQELAGKTDISPESQRLLSVLTKVFEELFCWSSTNGIEVRFSWGRAEGRWRYVVAEVEGCMSAAASELLQSEMTHLLKSIVKSVSLLEPCSDGWEPGEPLDGGLTALDEDTLGNQESFVRTCLDAFYGKPAPKPKDSIDKRIRNAVHLLMESDTQSNDALGLALSVTAMEALLGRGNTEISERLSTDIAVLLEPDLSNRDEATQFARGIYNLRSQALHGTTTEGDKDTREKARLLAAGILRAVITRRDFMRKSGFDVETPDELLAELRKQRFLPGQTVGVDEPNVRKLWEESHDRGQPDKRSGSV
mgnify:CR=1 FL=1